MKKLIIALLVLWLIFSVIGVVIEGLLWLLWIGILLFVATAAWGLIASRKG
jgi:hypothetical protein